MAGVSRGRGPWIRIGQVVGVLVMLAGVHFVLQNFLVETLRVDQAFLIGGSVNGELLVSGALALGFALLLLLRQARSSRRRSASD